MSANRKAFEFLVVTLLEHLYEQFPEATNLSGAEFCVQTVCTPGLAPEIKDAVPHVFTDTVNWLESEGFIRCRAIDELLDGSPGIIVGVVLTMKGLTLVGYTFEPSAGDRQTMAEAAKEIVSKGASDAASGWIKDLLGMAMKIGVNTFSG